MHHGTCVLSHFLQRSDFGDESDEQIAAPSWCGELFPLIKVSLVCYGPERV